MRCGHDGGGGVGMLVWRLGGGLRGGNVVFVEAPCFIYYCIFVFSIER